MNVQKAEQAIINGVYAGVAWLMLDFGLLLQEHGTETLSILAAQPEMIVGAVIVIACIVGLFYKSRFAAIILFLLFIVPLVFRLVQGILPSTMFILFSLILLYFFVGAVLGVFSFHQQERPEPDSDESGSKRH